MDYGKHDVSRTPDHPDSLFEGRFPTRRTTVPLFIITLGLAGTIYFLADVLHPSNARFPAFQ